MDNSKCSYTKYPISGNNNWNDQYTKHNNSASTQMKNHGSVSDMYYTGANWWYPHGMVPSQEIPPAPTLCYGNSTMNGYQPYIYNYPYTQDGQTHYYPSNQLFYYVDNNNRHYNYFSNNSRYGRRNRGGGKRYIYNIQTQPDYVNKDEYIDDNIVDMEKITEPIAILTNEYQSKNMNSMMSQSPTNEG